MNITRNESGSVAILFGLSAVVIIMAIGIAVDYARAHNARSHLQQLTDTAALAAARSDKKDKEDLEAVAKAFFESNDIAHLVQEVTGFRLTLLPNNGIRVEVDGNVATTFTAIAGIRTIPIAVSTETLRNPNSALEIVFALDNTGSMSGAKLSALKRVTEKIIDDVRSYDDVRAKFGLVPFSNYVNVGTSRRNEDWISVPKDFEETRNECRQERPVVRKYNCRTLTGTRYDDGVSSQYTYQKCDYEYGPAKRVCAKRTIRHSWRGCVGSRRYPMNVRDEGYNERIPGLMDIGCAQEIVALTDDADAVRNAVSRMTAAGETYLQTGLMWGWRMLSPQNPLAEGAARDPKNREPRKILLLLTDGANTLSPRFPYHDGNNSAQANSYLAETCKSVKQDGIELFTISFAVEDATIKQLLSECATDQIHYFDAGNEIALKEAFSTITASLVDIHIAR